MLSPSRKMNPSRIRKINQDWYGKALAPPAYFDFVHSEAGFLFTASRAASALSAPHSLPGKFLPELWRYDVAEIFFAVDSGRYLEINLAPSGAWWACWFDGIRSPAEEQPNFDPIVAQAEQQRDFWEASLFLPAALFPNPEGLRYNVTFILNSPRQTFHTLAPLPGNEPDFHQPDHFLPLPTAGFPLDSKASLTKGRNSV